ncbi:MAG: 2-C-methyl-D-erythritol 2,4-cyclodiphosphate synthase [Pseudanabaenaceae cyanobacterium SKYGB_i_bin29]|nr:2-C-methyl-D-erythritol 2,4-cyclodiphosphate synthase [Pseudanabaenaceae cyanobacterium SKYG29]MDW8421901.1 2-C-methyl-D-erythritol 2,4-cyclodiphosphate synthase [Pseudanabaenaceae cyanobacterium SKYGB_i_bin29]
MGWQFRVGTGYDIHRLVPDRRLVLGGVEIPYEKGLLGHSDADVLAHAIMDALLGALALGDIGHYFPPTDDKWRDADSTLLLQQVNTLIREKGWQINNIDTSVIAERPKLKNFLLSIRENLAKVLQIDTDRVSVKARTNEGLDAIGQGEAIAVHAVVLLCCPQE